MFRLTLILIFLAGLAFSACAPVDGEPNGLPETGEEDIIPGTPPGDPLASPMAGADQILALGENVYLTQCALCHGQQGEGVEEFPPLAGSPDVLQPDPTGLISFVLHGRDGQHAFGGALTDEEAASVVSFIRNSWGNQASFVAAEQVEPLR